MIDLQDQAAWALTLAYGISLCYELYRATVRSGTSRHDSMPSLLRLLPLYVVAAVVVALLFAGVPWASWVGLAFAVAMILVSILYYNPRVMPERRPGVVDWAEDLVYTGLLFVAAALLLYRVAGLSLV